MLRNRHLRQARNVIRHAWDTVQTAFNASHKGVRPKAVSEIETSKQGTNYEVKFKQWVTTFEVFYKADKKQNNK